MLSEIQTEKSRKNWRNFYAFKILTFKLSQKICQNCEFFRKQTKCRKEKVNWLKSKRKQRTKLQKYFRRKNAKKCMIIT